MSRGGTTAVIGRETRMTVTTRTRTADPRPTVAATTRLVTVRINKIQSLPTSRKTSPLFYNWKILLYKNAFQQNAYRPLIDSISSCPTHAPLQPHIPPTTTHAPGNHACPPQPCTPPSNQACPPVDRITDACENITLPQLRCGR